MNNFDQGYKLILKELQKKRINQKDYVSQFYQFKKHKKRIETLFSKLILFLLCVEYKFNIFF
jgi:division protein CdvB (Snf7/Vps24/ESCRT-III family)